MQTSSRVELELGRFRLPVCDQMVVLRHPSGTEDLLLLEAARTPSGDATLALALAGRLTRTVEGEPLEWLDLSVTDLDTLVLRLRQALIGDRLRADIACPASECRQRIDIDFRIEEFLDHHTPQPLGARLRGCRLATAEEAGWFSLSKAPEKPDATTAESSVLPTASQSSIVLDSESVRFRLPTVADLLAVTGHPLAEKELARRCLRPAKIPARLQRRIEAAMDAMAPTMSCDLHGVCPECAATVTMHFDGRWFCLRELRDRAAFLYQDIDLLARRYHWSETEILSMPQVRRAAYAELARHGTGA